MAKKPFRVNPGETVGEAIRRRGRGNPDVKPPKLRMGRPHKSGDPALDKDDAIVVGSSYDGDAAYPRKSHRDVMRPKDYDDYVNYEIEDARKLRHNKYLQGEEPKLRKRKPAVYPAA